LPLNAANGLTLWATTEGGAAFCAWSSGPTRSRQAAPKAATAHAATETASRMPFGSPVGLAYSNRYVGRERSLPAHRAYCVKTNFTRLARSCCRSPPSPSVPHRPADCLLALCLASPLTVLLDREPAAKGPVSFPRRSCHGTPRTFRALSMAMQMLGRPHCYREPSSDLRVWPPDRRQPTSSTLPADAALPPNAPPALGSTVQRPLPSLAGRR